ncbi:serine/threonine-protein kinase [Mycobacterium paragordonae]|uniref:non-specific serine/threonine protein kinase n=1 Tax=Mycobacterium paragordonae TaxID=1389713 RepID=A0A4R5WU32_9MYCO|nr:serine/threonine-protein kinase [Mycobacterium paragordonae]MDP7734241.1 serine/threonine-protein kinase [Mycobacterium paragordonae]TDK97172.1 serine/threonine protein kinase [Mycobacterium paragordonae]TDL11209.1 serine/threonine protein kinase [Mycobacterium paragordonae]
MTSPRGGSRVGTRFGPYELRSLLGTGGMGEVYRAFDTVRGRLVALKLLRPDLAADPQYQQRFRRESQIAARLQEPHVIPVHDFGAIGGVLFIDMRLVDGGSLRDVLQSRGPLSPADAVAVVAQVASALDAAHADGLVHRDVKPENVLINAEGFAYLVDFGIARGEGDPSLTGAGLPIGSYLYMAPERFNGEQVGPATDVYSLAGLLYESLTGRPPFDFPEPAAVMSAHLFSAPPRPSIMRRGISRSFDGVIAKGMAKQPAARFVSAGDLARSAAAVLSPPSGTRPFVTDYPNPEDTGFSPYPSPAPPPVAMRRRSRLPMVLGGSAALMLVIAALLAAILIFGNRSSPSTSALPGTTSSAPTLSGSVDGADALGFVGHTARCDPGSPPAAVLRTAKSLVVVCQSGPESFYYRGERISDSAHIELSGAVRASGGFDVVNPANGVRYQIRPEMLTILSGSHVDSAEPALQYAGAG